MYKYFIKNKILHYFDSPEINEKQIRKLKININFFKFIFN